MSYCFWVVVYGVHLVWYLLAMPNTVVELLACWQGNFGHHFNGVIWMAVPHCLMWCIWREKNNRCFKDSERILVDLKLLFFKTLSEWVFIIGSRSIFSVYDLMDACTLCIWLFWSLAVYFLYTWVTHYYVFE